jgi:hypothetical protein
VAALVAGGFTDEQAKQVVTLVASGKVPGMAMGY